jgi:hypothetical protein
MIRILRIWIRLRSTASYGLGRFLNSKAGATWKSWNSLSRVLRLQTTMSSTNKFNSMVAKTLKLVLCSSRDGVPLKFRKKTWWQYSSSVWIFWAWFLPLSNLAGKHTFKPSYLAKAKTGCRIPKLLKFRKDILSKLKNSSEFEQTKSIHFA